MPVECLVNVHVLLGCEFKGILYLVREFRTSLLISRVLDGIPDFM